MKTVLLAIAGCAWAMNGFADPQIASWFTMDSSKFAQIYRTDAEKVSGRPETTWSNGRNVQNQPAFCGVQEILSSADWIYVRSTGLGSQVMGPWLNGRFPNLPIDQHFIFAIPRHPAPRNTGGFNPLRQRSDYSWTACACSTRTMRFPIPTKMAATPIRARSITIVRRSHLESGRVRERAADLRRRAGPSAAMGHLSLPLRTHRVARYLWRAITWITMPRRKRTARERRRTGETFARFSAGCTMVIRCMDRAELIPDPTNPASGVRRNGFRLCFAGWK